MPPSTARANSIWEMGCRWRPTGTVAKAVRDQDPRGMKGNVLTFGIPDEGLDSDRARMEVTRTRFLLDWFPNDASGETQGVGPRSAALSAGSPVHKLALRITARRRIGTRSGCLGLRGAAARRSATRPLALLASGPRRLPAIRYAKCDQTITATGSD